MAIRYLTARDGTVKVLDGQNQLATIKQNSDRKWVVVKPDGSLMFEPMDTAAEAREKLHSTL